MRLIYFDFHALIVVGNDGAKRDGGDGGPGQLDSGRLHPGQSGKPGCTFALNVSRSFESKVKVKSRTNLIRTLAGLLEVWFGLTFRRRA